MGRKLIDVSYKSKSPIIICPHCNRENLIDITPFKEDVTRIIADKCTYCRAEISVGILILAHKNIKMLLQCIEVVANTLNTKNLYRG